MARNVDIHCEKAQLKFKTKPNEIHKTPNTTEFHSIVFLIYIASFRPGKRLYQGILGAIGKFKKIFNSCGGNDAGRPV
jgi:hypothetical protein